MRQRVGVKGEVGGEVLKLHPRKESGGEKSSEISLVNVGS